MNTGKLDDVREKITAIDSQLAQLLEKRLDLGLEVAKIKQKNNISITDEKREQVVEERFVSGINQDYKNEAKTLSRALIALSKIVQRRELFGKDSDSLFPAAQTPNTQDVVVVYQGVKGAWGEEACEKFFGNTKRIEQVNFEDVFDAISSGKATYGVLPIENSGSGAIGEVYDLLKKYGCYIVKQSWLPIKQCLMAKKGATLQSIRTIYSHPEGFRQCSRFLRDEKVDLLPTTNTAVAAEMVSKTDGNNTAAIASPLAAALYGLEIINDNIINDPSNKTRFIVISKKAEYDSQSDNISILFKTAHKSGALCDVLFELMAGGVNLSRIESRPSGNGEYTFFADLKGNITDENIVNTLRCAKASSLYLEVLGCFSEVV